MRAFALVAILTIAAIGIGVGLEPQSVVGSPNKAFATALVSSLLDRALLPPGSVAVGAATSLVRPEPTAPAIPGGLNLSRTYRARESEDAAFDYLAGHVPHDLERTTTGSGDLGPAGFQEFLVDELPHATPPVITAQLGFTVTARGTGSLVEVDALVAWYPDHANAEVVPSSTARIVVELRPLVDPTSVPRTTRVISAVPSVERLVAVVNALPVARPVAILEGNCSPSDLDRLTLSFEGDQGERLAVLTSGGCPLPGTSLMVTIGHRSFPALDDWDGQLLREVDPYLGLHNVSGVFEVDTPGPGEPPFVPSAASLTFTAASGQLWQVRTRSDGRFALDLPAGTYAASAVPTGSGKACIPIGSPVVSFAGLNQSPLQLICSPSSRVPAGPTSLRSWYKRYGESTLTAFRRDAAELERLREPGGASGAPSAVCQSLRFDVHSGAVEEGETVNLPAAAQARVQSVFGQASALVGACLSGVPANIPKLAHSLLAGLSVLVADSTRP